MRFFTRWFSRKATPETPLPSSGLTLVSNIPDGLLPLWQLYRDRQLLEVSWNQSQRRYQSLILALDLERNLLWLDDLTPSQRQLDLADTITLRHIDGQFELVISGIIAAFGQSQGCNGFAISLPYEVGYQSRRQYPRYSLEGHQPRFATLRSRGGEALMGVIQDIGVGGMRIQLSGNHTANFRPGMNLAQLDYQLGQRPVAQVASVRAVRFVKTPHRATQVSVCFADTSAAALQKRHEDIGALLSALAAPTTPAQVGWCG